MRASWKLLILLLPYVHLVHARPKPSPNPIEKLEALKRRPPTNPDEIFETTIEAYGCCSHSCDATNNPILTPLELGGGLARRGSLPELECGHDEEESVGEPTKEGSSGRRRLRKRVLTDKPEECTIPDIKPEDEIFWEALKRGWGACQATRCQCAEIIDGTVIVRLIPNVPVGASQDFVYGRDADNMARLEAKSPTLDSGYKAASSEIFPSNIIVNQAVVEETFYVSPALAYGPAGNPDEMTEEEIAEQLRAAQEQVVVISSKLYDDLATPYRQVGFHPEWTLEEALQDMAGAIYNWADALEDLRDSTFGIPGVRVALSPGSPVPRPWLVAPLEDRFESEAEKSLQDIKGQRGVALRGYLRAQDLLPLQGDALNGYTFGDTTPNPANKFSGYFVMGQNGKPVPADPYSPAALAEVRDVYAQQAAQEKQAKYAKLVVPNALPYATYVERNHTSATNRDTDANYIWSDVYQLTDDNRGEPYIYGSGQSGYDPFQSQNVPIKAETDGYLTVIEHPVQTETRYAAPAIPTAANVAILPYAGWGDYPGGVDTAGGGYQTGGNADQFNWIYLPREIEMFEIGHNEKERQNAVADVKEAQENAIWQESRPLTGQAPDFMSMFDLYATSPPRPATIGPWANAVTGLPIGNEVTIPEPPNAVTLFSATNEATVPKPSSAITILELPVETVVNPYIDLHGTKHISADVRMTTEWDWKSYFRTTTGGFEVPFVTDAPARPSDSALVSGALFPVSQKGTLTIPRSVTSVPTPQTGASASVKAGGAVAKVKAGKTGASIAPEDVPVVVSTVPLSTAAPVTKPLLPISVGLTGRRLAQASAAPQPVSILHEDLPMSEPTIGEILKRDASALESDLIDGSFLGERPIPTEQAPSDKKLEKRVQLDWMLRPQPTGGTAVVNTPDGVIKPALAPVRETVWVPPPIIAPVQALRVPDYAPDTLEYGQGTYRIVKAGGEYVHMVPQYIVGQAQMDIYRGMTPMFMDMSLDHGMFLPELDAFGDMPPANNDEEGFESYRLVDGTYTLYQDRSSDQDWVPRSFAGAHGNYWLQYKPFQDPMLNANPALNNLYMTHDFTDGRDTVWPNGIWRKAQREKEAADAATESIQLDPIEMDVDYLRMAAAKRLRLPLAPTTIYVTETVAGTTQPQTAVAPASSASDGPSSPPILKKRSGNRGYIGIDTMNMKANYKANPDLWPAHPEVFLEPPSRDAAHTIPFNWVGPSTVEGQFNPLTGRINPPREGFKKDFLGQYDTNQDFHPFLWSATSALHGSGDGTGDADPLDPHNPNMQADFELMEPTAEYFDRLFSGTVEDNYKQPLDGPFRWSDTTSEEGWYVGNPYQGGPGYHVPVFADPTGHSTGIEGMYNDDGGGVPLYLGDKRPKGWDRQVYIGNGLIGYAQGVAGTFGKIKLRDNVLNPAAREWWKSGIVAPPGRARIQVLPSIEEKAKFDALNAKKTEEQRLNDNRIFLGEFIPEGYNHTVPIAANVIGYAYGNKSEIDPDAPPARHMDAWYDVESEASIPYDDSDVVFQGRSLWEGAAIGKGYADADYIVQPGGQLPGNERVITDEEAKSRPRLKDTEVALDNPPVVIDGLVTNPKLQDRLRAQREAQDLAARKAGLKLVRPAQVGLPPPIPDVLIQKAAAANVPLPASAAAVAPTAPEQAAVAAEQVSAAANSRVASQGAIVQTPSAVKREVPQVQALPLPVELALPIVKTPEAQPALIPVGSPAQRAMKAAGFLDSKV